MAGDSPRATSPTPPLPVGASGKSNARAVRGEVAHPPARQSGHPTPAGGVPSPGDSAVSSTPAAALVGVTRRRCRTGRTWRSDEPCHSPPEKQSQFRDAARGCTTRLAVREPPRRKTPIPPRQPAAWLGQPSPGRRTVGGYGSACGSIRWAPQPFIAARLPPATVDLTSAPQDRA